MSGTGFGATEDVLITFDTKQVGMGTTDGTGSFTAKIKVPKGATPGNHKVKATGQSSGLTASKQFLVPTDWATFRFGLDNLWLNPYENVLIPSNVKGLTFKWSYTTGSAVFSSPAVAGGVV